MVIYHINPMLWTCQYKNFIHLCFGLDWLFDMLTAIYNKCSSADYKITKLPLFKYSSFLIGGSFNDICNSSYYSVLHPMVAQLVNNELSRMQKQPRPNLRFPSVAGLREMGTHTKTKNLYSTQKRPLVKNIHQIQRR
jgi:hypothetical protein